MCKAVTLMSVVTYIGLESALFVLPLAIRGRVGSEEAGVGCKGKVMLDILPYRVSRESVVWLGLKGSR